jgi:hypothetical protein
VARRAAVVVRSGRPQPLIAQVVDDVANGLDKLIVGHAHLTARDADLFRPALRGIDEVSSRTSVDQGLIAMLRPVVVDCLVSTGVPPGEALAGLPTVTVTTRTTSIPTQKQEEQ